MVILSQPLDLDFHHVPLDSIQKISEELETKLKKHINESFKHNDLDKESLKINPNKFNSLFTSNGYSSVDVDKSLILYREYTNVVKYLNSINLKNYKALILYPLFRKILIVTEGYISYTLNQVLDERYNSQFCKFFKEKDLFCCILDQFYTENSIIISKDDLLSNFSYTKFSPDCLTNSLEIISGLLISTINYLRNDTNHEPELLATFILFNNFQKILSIFLLICIVKNQKLPQKDNEELQNGEEHEIKDDSREFERISELSLSVLKIPEFANEVNFIQAWSSLLFIPIYDILSYGFSMTTDLEYNNSPFLELITTTLNNFSNGLILDSQRILLNLGNSIIHHTIQLNKLSDLIKDYFQSHYNQLMNIISTKKSKLLDKNVPHNTNSCSRDLSAYFQKKNLRNFISDYSKLYQMLSKLTFDLKNLSNSNNQECYDFIHNLSKFISLIVKIIILTDALEYITKKNPNTETLLFLKETLGNLTSQTVSIFRNLPFEIINGLFYYVGSKFNNKNLLAQMYIYNAIDYSHLDLQDYNKYVKMLECVLKASKELLINPIFFENTSKSQKLKTKYLSIRFSNICKMVFRELTLYPGNQQGIIYLFTSFCYSDNIYQNLLSKKICLFLVRLITEKKQYINLCKRVVDILLGLCFYTNFDNSNADDQPSTSSNGSENKISDKFDDSTTPSRVKPVQINAFNYLKILSNSPLLPWFLDNIALTYTCSFVKSLKDLIREIHQEPGCNCNICNFKCFFTDNLNRKCQCLDSMIVNGNPSIFHYLELINTISCIIPVDSGDRVQTSSTYIINTVKMTLNELVNVLMVSKGKGDSELKVTIFEICVKLAKAMTTTNNFILDGTNLPCLIKLSSILGYPEICKGPNTNQYMKLLLGILEILQLVLSKDHNEQFFDLHKGLFNSLVGKIEKFPVTLSKLEFNKTRNAALKKTYEGSINSILEGAKGLDSQTLRVIYSYRSSKFTRNKKLEEQENGLLSPKRKEKPEEDIEFTILVNLLFLLSTKVKNARSKGNIMEIIIL